MKIGMATPTDQRTGIVCAMALPPPHGNSFTPLRDGRPVVACLLTLHGSTYLGNEWPLLWSLYPGAWPKGRMSITSAQSADKPRRR